jgi:hypothetical protein
MGFERLEKNFEGPAWKKALHSWKNRNELETYYTNSLTEMNSYFEKNWYNKPSALVYIVDVALRRKPGTPEELVDREYMIPSPFGKPWKFHAEVPFEIKTGAVIQQADWISGRNEYYEKAQDTYKFNDSTFTPVEMILVQYIHDPRVNLILRQIRGRDRPQRKFVENREKEKSQGWAGLVLQPA